MAHESVWACRDETPQGGTYPERSPQCEETGDAEKGRNRHEDKPSHGPPLVAGRPLQKRDLGIRIRVGDEDRDAGGQRVIVRHWLAPSERDHENQQVLRDIYPIDEGEGRRLEEQKRQLRQRDAEEKDVGAAPELQIA